MAVFRAEYLVIWLVLALLASLPPIAIAASKMWQIMLSNAKLGKRERAIYDPVFRKNARIAIFWMAVFFGSMYGIATV